MKLNCAEFFSKAPTEAMIADLVRNNAKRSEFKKPQRTQGSAKMKTLMAIALLASALAADADDGKAYRICGLDGDGRLRLVESRKREVRPVVALPVEEPPLARASFSPGEKLDDFDCEALENHPGVVRIDAGEGGAASEVYLGGLRFRDFLARERKFRPPVAKNGFGRWEDAAAFAASVVSNGEVRTSRRFFEEQVKGLVLDEMVRPVAESEDGRNPAFRDFLEQGITNRVMQQLTSPKLGSGTIDIQHLKFGIAWRILPRFGKPKSNLLKLMKVFSGVKIKAELNGDVDSRLTALSKEIDSADGDPFTQILLAEALIICHRRDSGDLAVHPPDATNLANRIALYGERTAAMPERTRALYEQVRHIVAEPADANTSSRGFSLRDRRHLVERLRVSKADPWLADVFEGLLELDLAWYGKGDMFSYCPKANWPTKVYPHLVAAREAFYRAWQRHPELPEGAFGMMACEWELYHSRNAARWLGQLWDAELDTPWMYRAIRHRMLTWFDKEPKAFDVAYNGIAAVTKKDLEAPYRAAHAQPPVPSSFIAFPLTNEWRQASFADDDKAPGVTPFKDAGRLQNLQFDPERRAAVWPVWWQRCRMPVDHEGEIDVEFLPTAGSTNRVAFGVLVDGTSLAVLSQVTWRDDAYRFCCWRSPVGSDARCYPYVLGEKSSSCPLSPEARRFTLRYRLKDRTIVTWIDGKLVQKLWFTEAKGGWSELPGHYQPAYFGTGVKIHAIRYRLIPPNAGLEEFVR